MFKFSSVITDYEGNLKFTGSRAYRKCSQRKLQGGTIKFNIRKKKIDSSEPSGIPVTTRILSLAKCNNTHR
jgi:hypothetical protein